MAPNLNTVCLSEQERAERFFDLQRLLLIPLVGEERARDAQDYYTAGGPTGVLEGLTAKPFAEAYFVAHALLGLLAERLESYYVPVPSREKKNTEENPGHVAGRQALLDLHHYFNPEVLYSAITYPLYIEDLMRLPPPNTCPHISSDTLDTKANLFVLRRNVVAPEEARALLERTQAVQHVLSYSREFYVPKKGTHPWKGLLATVEELMLKLDPELAVDFAQRGSIERYTNADPEGYHPRGLYVTGPEGTCIVLSNIRSPDPSSPLIGRPVVYRIDEDSLGLTGKLIAVQ
ncbi:hypothetical protein HYW21_05230 [Candidatus Woesearchaeota archaeon]|nr:hypothetical protein [Candidatus Woesearchaeota archaeon]